LLLAKLGGLVAAPSRKDLSQKENPMGSEPRTLLKNGTIVDGTGNVGFPGDLLIQGERIREISESPIEVECETVDCTGKVVAPGFIDVHSHMDWIVALEGYEELKSPFTAQGCTTFVAGNCGFSPGGFRRESPFKDQIRLGADRRFEIAWDSMEGYFDHLAETGLSHNLVNLTGHGTTQISMRGLDPSPLEVEERAELLTLLDESMDQGSGGVSFGLGYEPGMFLPTEDVETIARLVADRDKIVTVHGRAYSAVSGAYRERGGIPHNVRSLQEMIDVARETGARLQYSHLMFFGTKSYPTYVLCLEVLDEAVAAGVDVMIDTYPYHCGNSVINVLLPPWFLAGLPGNYRDSEAVGRVERGLNHMSDLLGFGFHDIQVVYADHPELDRYNGMFLDEIAEKLGMTPARTILELSEKTKGRARILNHSYSDMEIVDALIRHPACLFMTDAVVSAEGVQNPACFGAFPLLLQYARDRRLLSLEEAVRKMTGASAERVGLKDRGFLRAGLAADITVFDGEKIKDNNTVTETNRPPTGIDAVFMNGRQVKKDDAVDGSANAGVVIRI
jgi:N-acyl-D-amino-acid deacylase